MASVPEEFADLLTRPLFSHLATVRPDNTPQVNMMWFLWDGEFLRFTHTTPRQKYRNLQANPAIAMSVADPDNGYRFLEVRGVLDRVEPDPTGDFYGVLAARYGNPPTEPVADAAVRVVLVIRPTKFIGH